MVDNTARKDSQKGPTLGIYLRMISVYRPLTPTKEKELARRAREGSREALDRLVGAHLRFVVGIARGFRARGLALMDLIAEGNVGLEKAARRYDERHDGRFTPIALRAARHEIERAVREQQARREAADPPRHRRAGG